VAGFVTHAARYAKPERSEQLVSLIEKRFPDDIELQRTLFESVVLGFQQRGAKLDKHVRDWGASLTRRLLDSVGGKVVWQQRPLPGSTQQDNPWVLQQRVSSDGGHESWFLTTLPSGEQTTGIIRSPTFKIPKTLSLYVAGHIGQPGKPVIPKNFIRLKDANTGQVLAESKPPRNDTAQRVEWQLKKHVGKSGYIEITDGDQRQAYAWLAVGRFSPPVIELPKHSPRMIAERLTAAASIARKLKLKDVAPSLSTMIVADEYDPAVKRALAEALLAIQPNSQLAALAPIISDTAVAPATRSSICRLIAERDPKKTTETLANVMRSVPSRLQSMIAQSLAVDQGSAKVLINLVNKGHASPRLLTEQATRQRLSALKNPGLESEIAKLTSRLPSPNEQATKLIAMKTQQYSTASPSLVRGVEVFKKNCAVCHQLEGQGKVVGPQLDGIGGRGLERLLEDMLDPNRNVDVAFRSTTIVTDKGKVLSGLLRREEGQLLVLVDNQGKEFTVAKSEVDRQSKTSVSLMPDNFGATIPANDFFDLIGFLLSKSVLPKAETLPDE
jgi:putative heme-binding domain-containing protein